MGFVPRSDIPLFVMNKSSTSSSPSLPRLFRSFFFIFLFRQLISQSHSPSGTLTVSPSRHPFVPPSLHPASLLPLPLSLPFSPPLTLSVKSHHPLPLTLPFLVHTPLTRSQLFISTYHSIVYSICFICIFHFLGCV